MLVVDDFSLFTWVNILTDKSQVYDSVKKLCHQFLRMSDDVSLLHSSSCKELTTKDIIEFCENVGLSLQSYKRKESRSRKVVCYKYNHILDKARLMLSTRGVEGRCWPEAVKTACYVLNRVELVEQLKQTPYEILIGKDQMFTTFIFLGVYAIYLAVMLIKS